MNISTAAELRALYLKFFAEKGHAVIPSASVIPENDPSVLFTPAGMHPLVPYLLGEKHPMGVRLVDVQKCIRTIDIDEVGDASHCTFFEMLGNWSLGDYFKRDAISWSWEFLTSPDWLGIDKNRLAFSVFAGDDDAPRDDEAASLWREMGVAEDRIFYLPKKNNWWIAGTTGPCGPDTEMFYINTDKAPCGPDCSPACDCGRYLEIWNDVFMQYYKHEDGHYEPLARKNVDTGMGLERTIGVLLGVSSVYETDLFSDIIAKIEQLSGKQYGASFEITKSIRIIADHMRTATIILGDDRGVTPSNVDQGYVLRRLIRRAVRHGMQMGIPEGSTPAIAEVIIKQYEAVYPELLRNKERIIEQLQLEEDRFQRTLKQGMKEFEKLFSNIDRVAGAFQNMREAFDASLVSSDITEKLRKAREMAEGIGGTLRPTPEMAETIEDLKKFGGAIATILELREKFSSLDQKHRFIDGRSAFKLYDTYGFPIEITQEMAKEKGLSVDEADFHERFRQHQEKSHAGADQKFKGGLADSGEETAKLHTATHLLHAALRKVLGEEVAQKGSNITAERLRFDFSFPRKMTDEEKVEVERLVNEAIRAGAEITMDEMTVDEAKAVGAIGLFESKYGERVKVYGMGDFSKEICGGPHAKNTGDLKGFKLVKEESSSAGVRRIKGTIG